MSKMVKNTRGAALVEYGILVGLIAVVSIAAVATLGTEIADVFSKINVELTSAL